MRSLRIRKYADIDDVMADLKIIRKDVITLLNQISYLKSVWNEQKVLELANLVSLDKAIAATKGKGTEKNSLVVTVRSGKTSPIKKNPGQLPVEEIKKQFTALTALMEKHEILLNIKDNLKHNLDELPTGSKTPKKTALAEVEKLIALTQKGIDEAKALMRSVATGKMPDDFVALANKVENSLKSYLSGRFDDTDKSVIVNILSDEKDGKKFSYAQFTLYIEFINLVNDEGFVNPSYYVVLTLVKHPVNGDSLHLNTFTRFRLPGFTLGHDMPMSQDVKINADRALKRITGQMKSDSIVDDVMGVEVPIRNVNERIQHKNIDSVFVSKNDPTKLVVKLKNIRNKTAANNAVIEIQPIINAVLRRSAGSTYMTRSKVEQVSSGFRIIFKFIQKESESGLQPIDFEDMKDAYNLSDVDINNIKKSLGVA